MKRYHAHVYFDLKERDKIRQLAEQVQSLKPPVLRVWKTYDHPVAPHPKPMLELHFLEAQFEEGLYWLNAHRKGLTILVHEDSGDDYHDHTAGATWLGDPLPIQFAFFEKIKTNPKLIIHKTNQELS